MSKVDKITVTIAWAWWWRPYCYGLIAMCWLTRRMPDHDKLSYWCKRAVRVKRLKADA